MTIEGRCHPMSQATNLSDEVSTQKSSWALMLSLSAANGVVPLKDRRCGSVNQATLGLIGICEEVRRKGASFNQYPLTKERIALPELRGRRLIEEGFNASSIYNPSHYRNPAFMDVFIVFSQASSRRKNIRCVRPRGNVMGLARSWYQDGPVIWSRNTVRLLMLPAALTMVRR